MICTVCKNNNAASHYCTDSVCTSEDYTELLCSECVETHKKQRATRDHIISALSLNICTVREKNNDASHYCSDSVCTSEEYTEYLCLECVETHKRQRATRNHIINAISVPENSPISPGPPPIPPKSYPISESYLKNIDDDYHDFDNDYNDDLYDEIYEEIWDVPQQSYIPDIPAAPFVPVHSPAPIAPKKSDIPTAPPPAPIVPVPTPLFTPKRDPMHEVYKPMLLPKKETPLRRPAVSPKTSGTVP